MLVAAAENKESGMPVPLKCRWKRQVGDVSVDIPGVSSNMYQISADDIGTHICVEASPADDDDELIGHVTGEIGPFELDPQTRRSLDNSLGRGYTFPVQLARAADDVQASPTAAQDHSVLVNEHRVSVSLSGAEVAADYNELYPKVIMHTLDTLKFQLVLSETRCFDLVVQSRASRDLLALMIRYFQATRQVTTSAVVASLLPPQAPLQQGETGGGSLDACIVLERLVSEVNKNMLTKEVSERVLRNTKSEKRELQEQLMESIGGCTDVIVGLQDQFHEGASGQGPAPDPAELAAQVRGIEAQNKALGDALAQEHKRREDLRTSRLAAEEAKPQLHERREERDMLRARLSQLASRSSTAQQQDMADQSHALELKRLRQDVEKLHNHKEQLRKMLQDKEREKQELQDNFFYVKGQLEKWQLRVAQDADGEGAVKELERHHQTVNNAMDERTRFSMRLESCLRDQEKDKVYHEQQIDRLMQANARLMEEKDRATREVQRVSTMYSDVASQLQREAAGQGGQTDTFAADPADQADASAPADPEEVARIRQLLSEKDEAIRAKEGENESLRTRIRKLAVE
uniref:Uncharacterized protein n=1 Tax=Zooxanthella nutricula TaxID=1333877 RepID=A0A7S2VMP6_9DINO